MQKNLHAIKIKWLLSHPQIVRTMPIMFAFGSKSEIRYKKLAKRLIQEGVFTGTKNTPPDLVDTMLHLQRLLREAKGKLAFSKGFYIKGEYSKECGKVVSVAEIHP